jgi:hypothetical protein
MYQALSIHYRTFHTFKFTELKGTPKGGGAPLPKTRKLKNTDFVDIMISKVLHDFPFSQN